MIGNFGWIPPTDERRLLNARYPFSLLEWKAPTVVNTELELPDLWDFYDQGATPRCVAFSSQFMSSINAYNYHLSLGYTAQQALRLVVKYNAPWLWKAIGGTSNGAYIEDALDVLRKGNVLDGTTKVLPKEGIQNYVHGDSQAVRTAAANGVGGLLGIAWHRAWATVKPNKNGIAILDDNPKTWGPIDGYHSIDWSGWWDDFGGARINNTWGKAWNKGAKVILTGKAIDYMIKYERSEVYVVTDIPVEPIPPPDPEPDKMYVDMATETDGEKRYWKGWLNRVK